MIKAFLDTNVLASGFASFKHPERAPAQILHAWRSGLFELYISGNVLSEFKKTLNDPYFQSKLSNEDIEEAVVLLHEYAIITPITANIKNIATHPEDDLVIAAAVSGKVDYLVTGDGPLLRKVSNYKGVTLISSNDFLEELQKQI